MLVPQLSTSSSLAAPWLQVKTKALKLAALIRREKGVQAGVDSFHRHVQSPHVHICIMRCSCKPRRSASSHMHTAGLHDAKPASAVLIKPMHAGLHLQCHGQPRQAHTTAQNRSSPC